LIRHVALLLHLSHAHVTDNDLLIIYGLKSGNKMNWVFLIEDIMLKCYRLVDYEFPYAMLASRFIDYGKVDFSNEIMDFTKASSKITKRHLKKLGMKFVDHELMDNG